MLPILPLRGTVVFPQTVVPLAAAQARSLRLIDEVMSGDRSVGVVLQHDAEQEGAGPDEVHQIGVIGTILQMMRVPDGSVRLAIQGNERMEVVEWVAEEPYLVAKVRRMPEDQTDSAEVQALSRNTLELFQRLVELVPHLPDELVTAALNIDDPQHLAYMVASNLRMEPEERQKLLEIDTLQDKLAYLNQFITKELDVLELGKRLQTEVQEELGKSQREYYLREQMKAIRRELGEESETEAEITELRQKVEEAGMPEEAEREARRELDRLSKLPPAAAEYGVIKTYLDWLTALPWNKSTEGEIDIVKTREILDEDHYDLEKVKDRILEYLAVRKLKQDQLAALRAEHEGDEEPFDDSHLTLNREPIICFVGPPGVGKTSLAQSIARALGRELTRMSLGGVRDEAEIRGHRRTYVGAMPGRIVQAIRRAGTNDPVFVLDEVDKLGRRLAGRSVVRAAGSARPGAEQLVPRSLPRRGVRPVEGDVHRDREHAGSDSGAVARPDGDHQPRRLYRRGQAEHRAQVPGAQADEGQRLAGRDIAWTDEALLQIIQHYTREAGVRSLEREIGSVCRKIATKVAEGKEAPAEVTIEQVRDALGRPRFFYEELAARTSQPGVAIGVGVSGVGGDIMFLEATRMPGKGSLQVTGQLGDVMKESAHAALSFVRSRASDLKIDPEFFQNSDIHIHVPAGAVPKDGPSAGVAMTTAIISLLTGTPVLDDVAMTGEITLRGQVLPVGGIKEKSLAASRAGLTRFVLPYRNEVDLDDVPAELKEKMTFIPVKTMDDVLEAVMPPKFNKNRKPLLTGGKPAKASRSDELAAASR